MGASRGNRSEDCGVLGPDRISLPSEDAMQYRVQFLDKLDNVLREMQADAQNAGRAFLRAGGVVRF